MRQGFNRCRKSRAPAADDQHIAFNFLFLVFLIAPAQLILADPGLIERVLYGFQKAFRCIGRAADDLNLKRVLRQDFVAHLHHGRIETRNFVMRENLNVLNLVVVDHHVNLDLALLPLPRTGKRSADPALFIGLFIRG